MQKFIRIIKWRKIKYIINGYGINKFKTWITKKFLSKIINGKKKWRFNAETRLNSKTKLPNERRNKTIT